jgi:hypothetical protein
MDLIGDRGHMAWIVRLQGKTGEALLAVARSSQALVIETLDRTAGASERKSLPLLHRVGRLQLAFVRLMLEDPAQFVDEGYDLFQRLTSLHREFAQRLFEVLDPRGPFPTVTSDAPSGDVLPFPTRRVHTSTS